VNCAQAHNFSQWAEQIIMSCPQDLSHRISAPLKSLCIAIEEIKLNYTPPIPPLLPRPALFVFSHVSSALYLLEHATWAWTTGEKSVDVDVEAFTRWVEESGLDSAVVDAQRARGADTRRSVMDARLVYGDELEVAVSELSADNRLRAHL
jgi:hypothetical protein